jgi:diguanylate cyclase (GGDEF)-like protein
MKAQMPGADALTWTDDGSSRRLVELLATLGASDDPADARRQALEQAVGALGADAGAVTEAGRVVVAAGLRAGELLPHVLRASAGDGASATVLEAGTRVQALTRELDREAGSAIVVCRAGDERFGQAEVVLLEGMARVLALGLRTLERQALLQRLARIQRCIVRRNDLQQVLDAVVEGARELLGDDLAGLRLVDPAEPDVMALVASTGIEREIAQGELARTPVGSGAGGAAISEDRLVVVDDYEHYANGLAPFAGGALSAVVAAPVHENGRAIGSLTVGSARPGRRYSATERETLAAFAEHASLALTDARNHESAVRQALYDQLTGLPNRTLLHDRLAQALARARRTGEQPSVLYLDLDNFKAINDTLGHAAGDALLRDVARRLAARLRAEDTASRLGGDEFAVLLERADEATAEQAAARLLEAFAEPFVVAGRTLRVSASLGVVTADGHADDALRHADLAMYAAKAAGKGRQATYRPQMQTAATERMTLEADLSQAVERGELLLHYQPVVRLDTGEIRGAEALLRWRHPERGLVPPGHFIALAEDTRLIVPIGRWVLREACRQAARWARHRRWLGMSVNVSVHQLTHPGFVGELAEVLADTDLPPETLLLEVTETVLMQDVEAMIERLWEVRGLGVKIAVDDFGMGHSCLQYLLRFPLDVLKMPREFVGPIAGAAHQQVVGRAILDLGASLGLRVVAEGIETSAQLARLRQRGCTLGQGFLFARPMEAERLDALLDRGARLSATALEPAG